MAQLVLLVVAAAWAAVLIPPMLRSRVENRPNSSVTDFRRQLNKLQSTATPSRGAIRPIGRPLAQSPLQRPAAGRRPGVSHAHHRQASMRGGTTTAPRQRSTAWGAEHGRDGHRLRTHGDPSGEHDRSHRHAEVRRPGPAPRREQGPSRRPAPRAIDPRVVARRRRSNVLFVLVVTTACTLFLAATTTSTVMPWIFATSFLALCGYVYMLAQLRQRADSGWHDGWLEQR